MASSGFKGLRGWAGDPGGGGHEPEGLQRHHGGSAVSAEHDHVPSDRGEEQGLERR